MTKYDSDEPKLLKHCSRKATVMLSGKTNLDVDVVPENKQEEAWFAWSVKTPSSYTEAYVRWDVGLQQWVPDELQTLSSVLRSIKDEVQEVWPKVTV